jgi:hypothetical protein
MIEVAGRTAKFKYTAIITLAPNPSNCHLSVLETRTTRSDRTAENHARCLRWRER